MTKPQIERLHADLSKRIETVRESLNHLIEQRSAAFREWAFLTWGVRSGTIVVDQRGVKYLVDRVDIDDDLDPVWKPWIKGHMQKKDGSYSTRLTHLYREWTLVVENSGA